MRSRLMRFLLVLLFLGVFVTLGLTHRQRTVEPDLFSAPAEKRTTRGFANEGLGLVKPAIQRAGTGWPASREMLVPERIEGAGGGFVLDWSAEKLEPKERLPNRWSKGLVGDDSAELVAVAAWYPAPEDDYADPTWKIGLNFRDAGSLAALDAKRLDELGVPAEFRTFEAPQQYKTPKIRLLFRTSGMEHPRFLRITGADVQTDAKVTYDLDSLDEKEPHTVSIGDWTYFDLALLVWHDTPMRFQTQILTGEPQIDTLQPEMGAEVVFGDRLRIQTLAEVGGPLEVNDSLHSFAPADGSAETRQRLDLTGTGERRVWITRSKRTGGPNMLVRASDYDFIREHCGWRREDGSVDFGWSSQGERNGVVLFSRPISGATAQPLELVFVPHVAELNFEIPGVPDAPNPGTVENLFDIVFPRITLHEEAESAEDHLLGMLCVAAQVGWDINNVWDGDAPAALPDDRTFVGMTPQQLLHWYLRETPGATMRYDSAERVLYFNEESESWLDRLSNWWDYNQPGWF